MIYPGPKIKPFILIHIAKSAGSSISKTLAAYIGEPREKYRTGNHKFIRATGIEYIIPNISNYFIFSIIRNPFARTVSFYHYKQQIRQPPHNLSINISFEEWIDMKGYTEIPHMHTQLCRRVGFSNECGVKLEIHPIINFIGKLESINDDWITICRELGINPDDCPLMHDKKSKHYPYEEYYNSRTRSIIENYFAIDFKLFNYSF